MEPTSIITALLPPRTAPSSVKSLKELSDEESALRHRLELKVERGLYPRSGCVAKTGDGLVKVVIVPTVSRPTHRIHEPQATIQMASFSIRHHPAVRAVVLAVVLQKLYNDKSSSSIPARYAAIPKI